MLVGSCLESCVPKSNCQSTGWNCSFSTGRQDRRGRTGGKDGGMEGEEKRRGGEGREEVRERERVNESIM